MAPLCVNGGAGYTRACTDLKEPYVVYWNPHLLRKRLIYQTFAEHPLCARHCGESDTKYSVIQTVIHVTQMHSRSDLRKETEISSVICVGGRRDISCRCALTGPGVLGEPQFMPGVPVSYQLASAVTVKTVPVWIIYGPLSFENQVRLDPLELESSPGKDNTTSKTHGRREDFGILERNMFRDFSSD